jgi:hypothetical protein
MSTPPHGARSSAETEPETSGTEIKLSTGETVRVLEERLHVLHEIEARQDRDLGVLRLTRDDGREMDLLVRHIVYVRPVR